MHSCRRATGGVEEGWAVHHDVLAVAGDHLSVVRARGVPPDHDGFYVEFVALWEVDDEGRAIAIDRWEVDDLRLALAELGRRQLADQRSTSQVVPHSCRADIFFNSGDVTGLATCMADDFVYIDRRPNTLIPSSSREQVLARASATLDVAAVGAIWAECLAAAGNVQVLRIRRWADPTVSEPTWDLLHVQVWRDGLNLYTEGFDLVQLAEARGRFEELVATQGALGDVPHNAAVEAMATAKSALNRGDLDAFYLLVHPDIDYVNHPAFGDPDGSAPALLEGLTNLTEADRSFEMTPVAVAGDRRAVFRMQATSADGFVTEWACFRRGR